MSPYSEILPAEWTSDYILPIPGDYFFPRKVTIMREIKTNIKKPELLEKRRNQILKAAMSLFRKKGYHATTMREICAKAKVNQGSFYDYFGNKEDVLVFMYKYMMYRKFDWGSPDGTISDWKDMEKFLTKLMSTSWNRDKNLIQLLYRETISLDKKTLREVMEIESDFIKWITELLRRGLAVPSASPKLEMIANMAIYINAFLPLRGWSVHNMEQEEILRFAVDMLITKLKELHPPMGGFLGRTVDFTAFYDKTQ
jgi:AcrR family transcriptional regulator